MTMKYLIMSLILVSSVFGQDKIFETNPGYIVVTSDTATVPVYIDGILVGHTPIENPIPVLQGPHTVSHHPPSIRDPFLQYGLIEEMKQVYVFSEDTVRVYLNTTVLNEELRRAKLDYRYTNYIGMGLIFILIWQLFIISS